MLKFPLVFIIYLLSSGLPWWLRSLRIPPAMQEVWVWSLDQENPLEKGMVTHSSILAWGIPQTEELGRLQSMGPQSRTRLKWLSIHTQCTDRKWLQGGVERFSGKKRQECKKPNHLNFGRGRGLHKRGRNGMPTVTDDKPARNSHGGRSYPLYHILLWGHPMYFHLFITVLLSSLQVCHYIHALNSIYWAITICQVLF